ncbi:hypothetical protein [Pedobacter suwonensis]
MSIHQFLAVSSPAYHYKSSLRSGLSIVSDGSESGLPTGYLHLTTLK